MLLLKCTGSSRLTGRNVRLSNLLTSFCWFIRGKASAWRRHGASQYEMTVQHDIFMISVRRGRGAVVEWMGYGGGSRDPPQKKKHLCPRNYKVLLHFDAEKTDRR